MLARLLRAITLGALLLALAGGAGLWWAGHPWAAAALVLAVAGVHAVVLGLEFGLLRLAHGDDPTPRATPTQLFRAWLHEVVTAPRVFCWRQPFCSRDIPDLLPTDAQGRRGVVLVHGFVCNRGLWNPWLRRLREQGTPFVAVNLEPVFGSIDDTLPCIEAAVQRLEATTGLAPVVVAHSMGGLAVRAWWVADGRAGRLHHVITLGTPHHGTRRPRPALHLLLQPLRQHRLPARHRHAARRRQPPRAGPRPRAPGRARRLVGRAAALAQALNALKRRSPGSTTPASISPSAAMRWRTSA
jgi:triacylglycerol lipase